MLAALALSLLSICGFSAGAAVVAAESGVRTSARSAPLSVPSLAAAPVLAGMPILDSSPRPVEASESFAATAAREPAPGLQAAPAAAFGGAPAPGARRILDQAASPEAEMSAAFDGADLSPASDHAPAAASARRLRALPFRLLSARDLGGYRNAPLAPTPLDDSRLFLYRHERVVRSFVMPVLRFFYDIRIEGLEHLSRGPVLIVSNHVSWLDAVLLAYAAGRPIRFVMYRPYYQMFGLRWMFRSFGVIPIAPKEAKELTEKALNRIRAGVVSGATFVMLPEGMLTRDGNLGVFRQGFEYVPLGLDVDVVPARIEGMWGSALSRYPVKHWRLNMFGRLLSRLMLLRERRPVVISFGSKLKRAKARLAREAVAALAPR